MCGPRLMTRSIVVPISLLTVAALLRLYRIGNQSLWLDEVTSLEQARLDWSALLMPGGYREIHPPAYYLCLKPVANLTNMSGVLFEATLRLPSAAFSTMAVLAVSWLGSLLFDRRTGAYAGLFFGVSAFAVWYGQEVRMYSLAMLLVTLQVAIGVQIADVKASGTAWVMLFVVSVAAGLTHWYAVFVWPVLVGYALWRAPTVRTLRRWGVLSFFIMLPIGVHLAPKIVGGRGGEMAGASDIKNLAFTLWSFWTGYSAGPSVLELHSPDQLAIVKRFLPSVILMGLGAGVVTLFTVWLMFRRMPRSSAMFIAAWLLFGLAGTFLLALATGRVHNARYSFIAFPAAMLLLGAAARYAARHWQRIAICGVYLLSQFWCLANYYWNPYYWREDYRSAATYLTDHTESRGNVLLSFGARRTLAAYGVTGWEWESYPHWSPWSEELRKRIARHLSEKDAEIWHLTGERWRADEQSITKYLAERFSSVEHVRWQGLELKIYRIPLRSLRGWPKGDRAEGHSCAS